MFLSGHAKVTKWQPEAIAVPEQAAVSSGFACVAGARLHYWDTGGAGPAVILLHPATGSDRIWVYQQPVFAQAGYRVIAWSRRGHGESSAAQEESSETPTADLHGLACFLGLKRFHLLGCAAGGGIALDYALSHPEHLLSLAVIGAVGSIAEPEYAERAARLRPRGFDSLPASFRELSPSYRAANPHGTEVWEQLEKAAITGRRQAQSTADRIDWAALNRLRLPVLVMGGAADLYSPPALLRAYAAHIPDAELIIVPEGGHSLYWEMPDVFNAAVLDFWDQHGCRG